VSGKDQLNSGYLAESEYRSSGPAVRPRDAATLIIVRRDGGQPRVLMGKRAATHKFMPNKFVFPGGRVDPGDSRIRPNHDLHPEVKKRLCAGCSETRARALALAAIRETYEETGLILGETETPLLKSRSSHWKEFLQHRINPRLDVLQLVARAITPPYRNRRFDARFFMADASHLQGKVHERPEGSGELLELHWVSLDKALELELPHITRHVLGEVAWRLQENHGPEIQGPFVHTRHGKQIIDRI
jgi:8-oxo-dGTP pyrophosphatase MutT (NUDIX family)